MKTPLKLLAIWLAFLTVAYSQVTVKGGASVSGGTLICVPPTPVLPTPPANAYTYANLQNATVANASALTAQNGSQTGSGTDSTGTSTITTGISSPSLSGSAVEFASDSTGTCSPQSACNWNSLIFRHLSCAPLPGGVCTGATHFLLDMWVYYATGNSSLLQAYEYDPDQYTGTNQIFASIQYRYLPSGQRNIYVYSKTPSAGWVATTAPLPSLSEGTWHHDQLYITMNPPAPSATYETLVVDGVVQPDIAGFTGGGDTYSGNSLLNTQFQIDGNGDVGTITEYADDWNLTVWGLSPPTASPTPGTYASAQSVALSAPLGTICYTTDGSTPAATTGTCTHGTTYSSAISVSSTTTINALTTYAGNDNSTLFTGTYTITDSATPVLVPFATPMNTGNNAVSKPSPVLAFGKQGTGTTSWAIPISISNCSNTKIAACTGAGSMTVSSMTISGANASDFALTGTCSAIASGADCEPTITFTPSASSGTNESATLTINYSGATVTNQTMSLTGTSATVTFESGCFTAASSTNYQLTGNISAAASCITNNVAGADINLNGHTLTYCTGGYPVTYVTAYSTASNVVTLTAVNSFSAGNVVTFKIAAGPTYLNNLSETVLSAGLSGTQFEVAYTGASGSGAASGNAGNGVLAGGVITTGYGESSATYHNGYIYEASGLACTGTDSTGSLGSAAITQNTLATTSQTNGGDAFFNLFLETNDAPGHVIAQNYPGTSTALGTTIHDVYYLYNGSYNCPSGDVGCRSASQFYPIYVTSAENAGPTTIYNVYGSGSPQGGIVSDAPNSSWTYTALSPGSSGATNSNGFSYQDWGPNMVMENNLTVGNGTNGACISCRGTQVSSVERALTGTLVENNVQYVTQLANDDEYGGCQLGGGYGMQLNTAGSGLDLSNNTFQGNYVVSVAGPCPGVGFSFSNASNGSGPNKSISNHWECDEAPGQTSNCAGMQFLAHEYSPYPDGSFVSTGDTILGDTSALYIYYDGSSSWQCNQCTFGTGTNPQVTRFLDYYGGATSGTVNGGTSPFTIVDPTFLNGMTKSENNLSAWAANNPTLSFYYLIQWTYTVKVEKSSNSAPISGATVTATDKNSTVECTTTTNSSGIASCVLNDTKYSAASGSYTTPSYNPMAIVISASGCTTDSYSETVTGSVTDVKTLSGC